VQLLYVFFFYNTTGDYNDLFSCNMVRVQCASHYTNIDEIFATEMNFCYILDYLVVDSST
jgi:hypothetical protein